jgi:hypothetical protein
MSLFRKKDLAAMLAHTEDKEKGLKRTLGAGNLVALGIGAIIGAAPFCKNCGCCRTSCRTCSYYFFHYCCYRLRTSQDFVMLNIAAMIASCG